MRDLSLGAHLRYLKYVLRHKYYVYQGCRVLGVSRWQALIHDWHKFTPGEWMPYVRFFYGPKPPTMNEKGYIHKTGQDEAFDRAWLSHQHRGKHHWQHWLLRQGDGQLKALEMPAMFAAEMVADWYGAGSAQGKPDIQAWYDANKDNIQLHPRTRNLVEFLLLSF